MKVTDAPKGPAKFVTAIRRGRAVPVSCLRGFGDVTRDALADPNEPRRALREERLAELTHQIAGRLRPLCPKMPENEFERMVARLAAMELRHTYGY